MNQALLTHPHPPRETQRARRRNSFVTFYLLPAACCLFFSGCTRPPDTAAELQLKMPPQYQGELKLQGETAPHRVILEPHDFVVRDTRLLAFTHVRYQFFTGNNLTGEGEAALKATISTPDLAIHVEDFSGEGGSDAVKPGSFQGSLSKDLREVSATWETGFGQKVTLKAKAVP